MIVGDDPRPSVISDSIVLSDVLIEESDATESTKQCSIH